MRILSPTGLGGAVLSVALASLGAATAVAQTAPQPEGDRPAPPAASSPPVEAISEAEWRALVSGKTLYYSTVSGFMGREYYPPNSNRSIFEYFDGTCFDGSWSQADGIYCFIYGDTHCFEHLRQGERIFVRELDGDEQDVFRITDEVLSCEPELLSRAMPQGGGSDAPSSHLELAARLAPAE